MNPWRSRQPAHRHIQAMRETAHSFRKSTAQRRLRSPQKIHTPWGFFQPNRPGGHLVGRHGRCRCAGSGCMVPLLAAAAALSGRCRRTNQRTPLDTTESQLGPTPPGAHCHQSRCLPKKNPHVGAVLGVDLGPAGPRAHSVSETTLGSPPGTRPPLPAPSRRILVSSSGTHSGRSLVAAA